MVLLSTVGMLITRLLLPKDGLLLQATKAIWGKPSGEELVSPEASTIRCLTDFQAVRQPMVVLDDLGSPAFGQ